METLMKTNSMKEHPILPYDFLGVVFSPPHPSCPSYSCKCEPRVCINLAIKANTRALNPPPKTWLQQVIILMTTVNLKWKLSQQRGVARADYRFCSSPMHWSMSSCSFWFRRRCWSNSSATPNDPRHAASHHTSCSKTLPSVMAPRTPCKTETGFRERGALTFQKCKDLCLCGILKV